MLGDLVIVWSTGSSLVLACVLCHSTQASGAYVDVMRTKVYRGQSTKKGTYEAWPIWMALYIGSWTAVLYNSYQL